MNRFNEEQKAEYNRRVKEYCNENYYLKDARAMARRDVENAIFAKELEQKRQSSSTLTTE